MFGERGECVWGKEDEKVIPFAVMTMMLLSATLPAFAASGFVFEDWDLGVISERKEKLDDTDDIMKRRKKWQKRAASPSELMNADVRATPSELRYSKVIEGNSFTINHAARWCQRQPRKSLGKLGCGGFELSGWNTWTWNETKTVSGTHETSADGT